ncbi:7962_t:CDS:2, partial [Funneliformis geosporum]
IPGILPGYKTWIWGAGYKILLMPAVNLKNITIKEKEDKNFNKYYLIVDNDTDKAYFCFEKAVKEGWDELVNN